MTPGIKTATPKNINSVTTILMNSPETNAAKNLPGFNCCVFFAASSLNKNKAEGNTLVKPPKKAD